MLGEEPVRGQNAALVRRLFEVFADRDVAGLLEIVDPQIEFFGPTATALNEGRCYRGHDGMRRYMRDVEVLWEELTLEPAKLREVGSHVVVLGRVHGRARDGLEIESAAAWVWRIERGRITWGCAYGDPDRLPPSMQEGGRADASITATRASPQASREAAQQPLG